MAASGTSGSFYKQPSERTDDCVKEGTFGLGSGSELKGMLRSTDVKGVCSFGDLRWRRLQALGSQRLATRMQQEWCRGQL